MLKRSLLSLSSSFVCCWSWPVPSLGAAGYEQVFFCRPPTFNVTANLDPADEFRRALQNRVYNALTGVFNASGSYVNLTEHPGECAFEATLHNLMAIRVGPHPDCGMTEVHILIAKSDYREFFFFADGHGPDLDRHTEVGQQRLDGDQRGHTLLGLGRLRCVSSRPSRVTACCRAHVEL